MNEQTTAVATRLDQGVAEMGFLNPGGFAHLQRVAKVFNTSSLVPEAFQGEANLGNCVIALDMAHRLGANPLAVMQNLYIVYGKPGWSAQWIIAAANTSGRFEAMRFDVTGKGDDETCVAWTVSKGVRLPDGVSTLAQAKEYDVAIYEGPGCSIRMAKDEGWMQKKGSKWQTMPGLMLRYRAATFFGRLYTPELLMGMKSADEIVDIEATVTPLPEKQQPSAPPPPTVPKRTPSPAVVAATTGTPTPARKGPTLVEQPLNADEAAEAAAGLAPEASTTNAEQSPHDKLAAAFKDASLTFDDFAKYGRHAYPTGNNSTGPLNWDNITEFGELPPLAVGFFLRTARHIIGEIKEGSAK